jgi:glutamate-1-semialdehyde 2,1-aminomutase
MSEVDAVARGLDDALGERYRAATPGSAAHSARAREVIPGGASRDSVGRQPYAPFIVRGRNQLVYDVDGNEYVDFCLNLGPILLGHGFAPIARAVSEQISAGAGFGAPSELEAELAERVTAAYAAADKVRFLATGSEAIMLLVRVAKAFTGRSRILKFIGAYHGSHDSAQLSVRPAGARQVGERWHGLPQTEGLSPSAPAETLAVPYNDIEAVADCLAAYEGEIALVLIDPSMNASALAPPNEGFFAAVREAAHSAGALFAFDEVVTGFRYGLGGAAERYGVDPDLVAFGKALGGGLPIGAVAGRRDVLAVLESEGGLGARVGQSGTFAGNPVTMAAGIAALDHFKAHPEGYARAEALGDRIRDGLRSAARDHGLAASVNGVASMFQIHVGVDEIVDYATFARRDPDFRRRLFLYLAQRGIFAPPPTATFFLSWCHTDEDGDRLVEAVDSFLAMYKDHGNHA